MRKGNHYSDLVACVCFFAIVVIIITAILCGLMKEWRDYCEQRERYGYADFLDCDNWGYDCEDIA